MKYYYPTDEEIRLIKQSIKNVYVRIELVNRQMLVVNSLEGNLISDNFTIDASSVQRRTYQCNLFVTNSSMQIGPLTNIQLDKYIRVYYGIKSNRTLKIKWQKIGTFTFITPAYTYNATTKELSLACGDLMADYDGTKSGQLTGAHSMGTDSEQYNQIDNNYSFKINRVAKRDSSGKVISYTKMSDAIKTTLKLAGIPASRYSVEEYSGSQTYVPYILEFNSNETFCDIWTKLAELYPGQEFYFDIDGNFIWQKIPTGLNEEDAMDNNLISPLLLSENYNTSFSGIYNATEVYGKSFDLTNEDRYANTSTYSNNTYTITLPLEKPYTIIDTASNIVNYLDNYDRIAFKCLSNNTGSKTYLQIKGTFKDGTSITFANMEIKTSDNKSITANTFQANKIYVLTYRRDLVSGQTTNLMVFNGGTQAYGYYEEKNKNCPFSSTALGYVLCQRVAVDTDNTDDVCFNRARRLTYESCAMKDTINLSMIIIPQLDVNQKFKYTSQFDPEREKRLQIDIPEQMIQSISWSTLDGTMNLSAYRYRADFSYVINN